MAVIIVDVPQSDSMPTIGSAHLDHRFPDTRHLLLLIPDGYASKQSIDLIDFDVAE